MHINRALVQHELLKKKKNEHFSLENQSVTNIQVKSLN